MFFYVIITIENLRMTMCLKKIFSWRNKMEQVQKSEQINSCMQMVIDYDKPLNKQKDILAAYKKALGENVQIFKYNT